MGPFVLSAAWDFDPEVFGRISARFRNFPVENDLAAGIERIDANKLPPRQEVERWCESIINSSTALTQLGGYDAWVNTLGFPLARLANEEPGDAQFYRALFLRVSASAPNYDAAATTNKWDDLDGAVDEHRDLVSSWRSLRHFARQHGYVDPLPDPQGGADRPDVTHAGNPAAVDQILSHNQSPDPLRFTDLPLQNAVSRINTEYFVSDFWQNLPPG